MNDGSSLDDFRAKLFRDREHPGDWRIEKLQDEGGRRPVVDRGG